MTKTEPDGVTSPRQAGIDWARTTAWGEGGYYARVFLNVEGREPEGTIPAADYEAVRDDLAAPARGDPRRRRATRIATRVYKPEELYDEVEGVAPDLIVIFGDLLWRSVGTIGGDEGVHTLENDTGPDDANHAQDGVWIAAGAGVNARGTLDAHLLDVAPTVLEMLGLPVPGDMRGHSLAAELGPPREPDRLRLATRCEPIMSAATARAACTRRRSTSSRPAASASTRRSPPPRGRVRRRRR